ncbi:hypothetical protein O3P69_004608 [Scylla paramamosain]|uniref:Uncharacterized protein n=1 Tax=Scylla paramamosain TaxID=85552 RepID=A0AAW0UE93_SCYPA
MWKGLEHVLGESAYLARRRGTRSKPPANNMSEWRLWAGMLHVIISTVTSTTLPKIRFVTHHQKHNGNHG